MAYALILGVMAAVLGVKVYTLLSLGRLEREVRDLREEDQETKDKLNALDATRTQLERDHKGTLADIERLDIQKVQLMTSVQKYGVTPVEEPPLDEFRAPPSLDEKEPEAALECEESETSHEEGAPAAAGTEPAVEGESPATDSEEGVRILIVDDNDELRDLLSEAFSRLYVVDRATDGLEALNLILKQGKKYDAVLTDLNMPNIDGMTFLENVPEEISVIVMSAYLDRPEFSAVAAHPRVYRVLEKPFRLGMIKEAVARLLEDRGGAEPLARESDRSSG